MEDQVLLMVVIEEDNDYGHKIKRNFIKEYPAVFRDNILKRCFFCYERTVDLNEANHSRGSSVFALSV